MQCTYNEYLSGQVRNPPPPPQCPPVAAVGHRQRGLLKSVSSSSYNRQCFACTNQNIRDRLFDEGYRADVVIHTDHDGVIYAHSNILENVSTVFRSLLKPRNQRKGRKKTVSICGVPPEAVHVFIRFLYSSCYVEEKMEEYAMQVLVLAHAYAVSHLKQFCEKLLEEKLITSENVIDIFQLALLCDAPRLTLVCHRYIAHHYKAVSATDGWRVMRRSHPILEQEILQSIIYENSSQKERIRKVNEKKVYSQLYEAMEALVHICKEGCRTIGPHDKVRREDEGPCRYEECKGMELLLRHFAGCKKRAPGGCVQCKRMWQLLELHSRLCPDPDVCRVPLCRDFKQKKKQNKKVETKWRTLVEKIVRSKSISGAPFFSLESYSS